MKYLVCTRGIPQRVRAGVWFTQVAAEYELSKEQLAAVEADEHLVVKPVSVAATPKASQPPKAKTEDK